MRAGTLEELNAELMKPSGQVDLSRTLSHAVRAVVGDQ